MIALIDTNIVLDVMLARQPFVTDSSAVLATVEKSLCRGLLCAAAIPTIHYIARREIGTPQSLLRISELLSIFEIAIVNRSVLVSAATRDFSDFEDAVLHESALQAHADCIVTRNLVDFRTSLIPVYSPAQFIQAVQAQQTAEISGK